MRQYQKLEIPQLIELEGEPRFVIAAEIDISEMKNGLIFMKGESYNYENGLLEMQREMEIQYSTNEDAYYELDDQGNILD